MSVILLLTSLQVTVTPQATEAMRIEVAVARYIGSQRRVDRRMGFQVKAQEWMTPHQPTGPLYAAYRTARHNALLAKEAGAVVVGDSVSYCSDQSTPGCVEGTIRIGVPEITGDSAKIWYYSYDPRSMSDFDIQLLVVRGAAGWSVATHYVQFHETLSGPAEPRRVDSLEGCYRFDQAYFRWFGLDSMNRRLIPETTAVVHLFIIPAARDTGLMAYFFNPVPGPRDSAERHRWWHWSEWSEIGPDSIRIVWRNGFFGPVFRLKQTPEGLSGTVLQTTDVIGEPIHRRPAAAIRMKC